MLMKHFFFTFNSWTWCNGSF